MKEVYFVEAKGCLATGGYLLIAETTKSIKGRLSGIRDLIKKQSFEIYVDEERGDFTFFEARELRLNYKNYKIPLNPQSIAKSTYSI